MPHKALCFVAMPFGKKSDLTSGVEIDFDQIYDRAIKPAIVDAGLEPLRADEERTGGIIHAAMFARLLLAEFAVVDLSLANPNVFYELGVRHAAKPYTTIPIYATLRPLPFDVALMRALGYTLENGVLTEDGAAKLRSALKNKLDEAVRGAAVEDSPIFQLIPSFPGIDLPHDVTDAFKDRVQQAEEFRNLLGSALAKPTEEERREALDRLQQNLGDLRTVQREALIALLLSYRDVSAWESMVRLCESLPDYVKKITMVRQQWALALNRRKSPGDRDKAVALLNAIVEQEGGDPETLGILGRVHKDRYKDLKEAGSIMASAALDDAIAAYTRGFESDPRDYYPGVNAITLLIEKGDAEALKEVDRLVPLVSFAVARRGGTKDYWSLATMLELACVGNDWLIARQVLPKVLAAAGASWMTETTLNNLNLLREARKRQGQSIPQLDEIVEHLKNRTEALKGGKNGSS
ncbi:TRAFs-binding domain-containing protein [Desulforhabdus sp. TSK]|uniref:TRAFs-binding domain-containing protein n=1 Tax=Desulforhabdus sp. TSK TaxID=2925014 RepID=UPI001FC86C26|nr:TRAFs-binding domain-containing protein [Desulforhabdus sp. TSK]GKT08706.1 hypothetical protein DSTSK_20110 [Desulforhabdus sp. TSK]